MNVRGKCTIKEGEMEKILIVMRGISGSGKSTLARKLASENNGVICSTDDFFMVDGVYKFNARLLGVNHKKNQDKCEDLMKNESPCIIIDNTNIKKKDYKHYLDLAQKYGYTVVIKKLEWNVQECINRNLHEVPAETILKMAQNFED
jgi:predicted kinase